MVRAERNRALLPGAPKSGQRSTASSMSAFNHGRQLWNESGSEDDAERPANVHSLHLVQRQGVVGGLINEYNHAA
jgi:hypothetical protein